MGVHNTYLRQKILLCTEEVAQMEARLAKKLADIEGVGGGCGGGGDSSEAPSAPPASLDPSAASAPPMEEKGKDFEAANATPSAPPTSDAAPVVETFKSTECVVCMENKVRIRQRQRSFIG